MLTATQRQALRGKAHSLDPIVIIGEKGLTQALLAEIDRGLKVHELIKIRAGSMEREERAEAMAQICRELHCEPVQIIGKLLVIYRQMSEDDKQERALIMLRRRQRRRTAEARAERQKQAETGTGKARQAPARGNPRTARTERARIKTSIVLGSGKNSRPSTRKRPATGR